MKSVEAINDKIAFKRRKALLEQIDFNPDKAASVTREKSNKEDEKLVENQEPSAVTRTDQS